MNGLRLILHAIVDPHMRRYHTTSPHFLVLPQPGTTLYRTGTALLCYLSPVSLLCLLMDWSLTRQWDLYAILTTLFVISTGLYAFAAATEQWLRSRTDNVLDRGWSHLYQVLIDFRRHDDIRHVLRTALDQHDRLSNHAYAHLIPEIAACCRAQGHVTHTEYPVSFLVTPHLACLSELGYQITRGQRPSQPRGQGALHPHQPPRFAPAA